MSKQYISSMLDDALPQYRFIDWFNMVFISQNPTCQPHQVNMPLAKVTLTHWGRVTDIWVSKLTIIGSDNGLLPGRRQAIILTNAGDIVNSNLRNKLQWNLKQNLCVFSQENAFENVICEVASILSRPQCVKSFQNEWSPQHQPSSLYHLHIRKL